MKGVPFLSKRVYKRIKGETSAGEGGGGRASLYKTCWVPSRNYSYLNHFFYHFSICCPEVFAYGNSQITLLFYEQRIDCELPASNCADITGSLHVKFCRATSARYNNGRPPACWIAICWLQVMVVKARSEKNILWALFWRELSLFLVFVRNGMQLRASPNRLLPN